jgi:Protein of unknown function (DUF4239)
MVQQGDNMGDWLHALPVGWMAVVVFAATYLATAGIYWLVMALAKGDMAPAFKGVTPGMLPPLGIMFGLLIAFVAAEVWGDLDRAHAAVNHEASALRAVVILSSSFPGEPEKRLRGLITRHIEDARDVEWPAMARRRASIVMIPAPLAQAVRTTLSLSTTGTGQVAAQREILSALETALDARRQRILVSQSAVNWVKWSALLAQAACALAAMAMVHCDSRVTAALAMGLFATAVAVCILVITAHDRPFSGQLGVHPTALLQILPDAPSGGSPP